MTIFPRPTDNILILHIGTPKAGSSAIQTFLSSNRGLFHKKTGFYYPQYGRDDEAAKGIVTTGNGGNIARALLANGEASFETSWKQIEASLSKSDGILYSAEGFWAADDAVLAGFLSFLAARTHVKCVFYAGAQLGRLRSLYRQRALANGASQKPNIFFEAFGAKFEYARRLKLFEDAIGPGNALVRKYDVATFRGGDILSDFLPLFTHLGAFAGARRGKVINPTVDEEHFLYMRALRAFGYDDAMSSEQLTAIMSANSLKDLYLGAQPLPQLPIFDADFEAEIVERYKADNDALGEAFDFNRKNLADLKADPGVPPKLSRLELLLLFKLAELQARAGARVSSAETASTAGAGPD